MKLHAFLVGSCFLVVLFVDNSDSLLRFFKNIPLYFISILKFRLKFALCTIFAFSVRRIEWRCRGVCKYTLYFGFEFGLYCLQNWSCLTVHLSVMPLHF
jgi:hypothetical protein